MSAHTPGPWFLRAERYRFIRVDANGGAICHLDTIDGEGSANARLISAAPDMYAVLRELAECSQYWSEYDVPLGIHDRITAALAKAGK